MRWQGRRESDNVEDRRNSSGGGPSMGGPGFRLPSGKGGIILLIVVLVVAMRLISVFFDIQLPGALARHNTYLPSEAKYLKRPVIHPDRNDDDIKRK